MQNSTIEAYLKVFVNWKLNNLVYLLPIAEFAYNNTKNVNISHTSFEPNCYYYPKVFSKDNIDSCSRSCSADKLAKEIKELIDIC